MAAVRDERSNGYHINEVIDSHVTAQERSQKLCFKVTDNTKRTKKKDIVAMLAVHGKINRRILLPTRKKYKC